MSFCVLAAAKCIGPRRSWHAVIDKGAILWLKTQPCSHAHAVTAAKCWVRINIWLAQMEFLLRRRIIQCREELKAQIYQTWPWILFHSAGYHLTRQMWFSLMTFTCIILCCFVFEGAVLIFTNFLILNIQLARTLILISDKYELQNLLFPLSF